MVLFKNLKILFIIFESSSISIFLLEINKSLLITCLYILTDIVCLKFEV